jgi:hypothetical protein
MRAARRATLSPLPQIYGNLVQETGGGNTLSLTASHFIDILHLESPGLSVKGPAWFLLHKTFFTGTGFGCGVWRFAAAIQVGTDSNSLSIFIRPITHDANPYSIT